MDPGKKKKESKYNQKKRGKQKKKKIERDCFGGVQPIKMERDVKAATRQKS